MRLQGGNPQDTVPQENDPQNHCLWLSGCLSAEHHLIFQRGGAVLYQPVRTAAMAGYSATLRIDGFLQLPLQSFNMAITTFVGQNIGARKYKRVKKGIFAAWVMSS